MAYETNEPTQNANTNGPAVGSSAWLAVLAKNLRAEADVLHSYYERAPSPANEAAANILDAIANAVERTQESTAKGEICDD